MNIENFKVLGWFIIDVKYIYILYMVLVIILGYVFFFCLRCFIFG